VTKDEHVGNDFPGYAAPQPLHGHDWIDLHGHERGSYPMVDAHFMPVMCNQCDDPACLRAAREGAVSKRSDGIVIIDPVKAKGQRQIVDACPYGAIYWDEELKLPQKWIFDAHLLDRGWTRTRAEQACPTGALKSLKVSDEEMKAIAAAEELEVLLPEANAKPRVYSKNLYLMNRCFVGGTVVTTVTGREDCVEGAKVVLSKNGKAVADVVSDVYGEFKIDRLEAGSGQYELAFDKGKAKATRSVVLGESQYIGTIAL
jgi:Fe-S-cluster-containing dehydrogenase component